ncbi:hypothetical protein GCM10011506_14370 [Marivirga lumbricoides]|uniref:Auto-transporter adhesin head GIN domain-containing protein n=1 Tax=Marivirga lumbricoides TaxID=1046115 RepID=A0ABQ1LUW4_9BACT|nr:hypothetical protein GCM10011506_14370 [Marivirga lumbricoides]
MKLSNKVLIGFFGLILVYMIAAFTEIRLNGDLNRFDDSNSIKETVDVESFSYLVLPEMNHRIDVMGSGKARLEVRSISGDLIQKINYSISGDTLTITPPELSENKRVKITLYVDKNLFKGMTVNSPGMRIDSLNQESLAIMLNSGWIRMLGNNKISQLNIKASNEGSLNIEGMKLDLLNVQLDSSKVISDAAIKVLEGSISNKSYLHLGDTQEIRMKKDDSSRLDLY